MELSKDELLSEFENYCASLSGAERKEVCALVVLMAGAILGRDSPEEPSLFESA